MHVEICACLRLLARLHYIMGDYAEVGLEHPPGCVRRPWGPAWLWGMAREGAGAVFSLCATGGRSPGLGTRALTAGLRPRSPRGPLGGAGRDRGDPGELLVLPGRAASLAD